MSIGIISTHTSISYLVYLWSHAHQSILSELAPTDYGWREENGKYKFKWFDGYQVPPTITGVTIIDEKRSGTIFTYMLFLQYIEIYLKLCQYI